MVDTVITLGNFQFRNMEIPEFINFGGDQKLSVKELVGGARIVDVMGPSHGDPQWSGLITGPDAMSRAQSLNAMRIAGRSLNFSVFSLSYQVVIESFVFKTEKFYQISFDIKLKVVTDYNQANTSNNTTDFTTQVNNDASSLTTLSNNLNDTTFTTSVTQLNNDLINTPSIDDANPTQINTVNNDINSSLNYVDNTLLPNIKSSLGL